MTAGAGIVILPQQIVSNPLLLTRALVDHRVTHLTAVPPLLQALLPYLQAQSTQVAGTVTGAQSANQPPAESSCSAAQGKTPCQAADADLRLKMLISSGEALSSQLACSLQQVLPRQCRLLNLYGSTEVAADSTWVDTAQLAANAAHMHAATAGIEAAGMDAPTACVDAATAGVQAATAGTELVTAHMNGVEWQSSSSTAGRDPGSRIAGHQQQGGMQTNVPAGWPLAGFAICILRDDKHEASADKHKVMGPEPAVTSSLAGACQHDQPGGSGQGAKAKRRKMDAANKQASLQNKLESAAHQGHEGSSAGSASLPQLQLCEEGEEGEVAVAGAGLAAGYYRSVQLQHSVNCHVAPARDCHCHCLTPLSFLFPHEDCTHCTAYSCSTTDRRNPAGKTPITTCLGNNPKQAYCNTLKTEFLLASMKCHPWHLDLAVQLTMKPGSAQGLHTRPVTLRVY